MTAALAATPAGGELADRICLFSAALRGWDAPSVAQATVDAGLTAIEWAIGPQQPITTPREGAQALPALMRERGLSTPCVTVQGGDPSLLSPRSLEPFLALAAELDAPCLRVFPPDYDGGPVAEPVAQTRAALREAVAMAAEHDVALLVEVCPGTIAPSTAHALALLQDCPAEHAGVVYDPGNMVIEGSVDPRLAIAELGPLLKHVHVKNVAWRRQAGAWNWRHATLTTGMLDWSVIVAEFVRVGYRGWLSLDHLAPGPSVAAVRRDAALLRASTTKRG